MQKVSDELIDGLNTAAKKHHGTWKNVDRNCQLKCKEKKKNEKDRGEEPRTVPSLLDR